MIIKTDCRFFKGDMPCKPHKDNMDVHCENCSHYIPVKQKILIIKLGAMGDVIRTTPLLTRLKKEYPYAEISWLTDYPDVLPPIVDKIFKFDLKDILTIASIPFDVVYNLDKDREACALMNLIKADIKKGFHLKDGKCAPIDSAAYHKWLTGLFDDVTIKNLKSYPEEIFEICGFSYDNEEYLFNTVIESADFNELKKKQFLIGLNTGCGSRWATRLWPERYWIELAKKLKDFDTDAVFLGGPEEEEKNRKMAIESQSQYIGHFPIRKFASLVKKCDLIVTGVSMALNLAIAMKRKVVLLNNVFNKNEFGLYGRGIVIEPNVDCLGCYRTSCDKQCMKLIKPDDVAAACQKLLCEIPRI